MSESDVFQVIYPGYSLLTDPLELWQPNAQQETLSIDGDQPSVVWYADLPEDPVTSYRLLNMHAVRLRQTNLALEATGPLLEHDMQRTAIGHGSEGQVNFGGPPVQNLSGSANERTDLVAQAINGDPGSVSYGLKDELSEALETVSHFASLVHRLVDQFALIVSSHGGLPSARTRVEWLGDVHTWWAAHSPSLAISDHRRVLSQALATRQAWLRLATTITAGAAKIGMAMATGPFNPMAIMTVWKYVKKVIEQYRTIGKQISVSQ